MEANGITTEGEEYPPDATKNIRLYYFHSRALCSHVIADNYKTERASPKSSRRPWLLFFSCILLIAALSLQLVAKITRAPNPPPPPPLATIIPASLFGWSVQDLPLAETEELRTVVVKLLRYDDSLFRVYSKEGLIFGVYIAYWSPGKSSYYDAGMHTPDTCWINSGWTRNSRSSNVVEALTDAQRLKPAEIGMFSKDSTSLHVAFWHLVGGEVNTYPQFGFHEGWRGFWERLPNYVRDVIRHPFDRQKEQFFIRLTSNRPLDHIWSNPDLQTVIDRLSVLGLTEKARP